MPKVTVYIRKEDYHKWQALEKKTAFVSSALRGESIPPVVPRKIVDGPLQPLKVPEAVKQVFGKAKEYKFCKHGADPEMCKFAKPGRPCKS